MPIVNPRILTWARESAGLDLAEAARKIGLKAARGLEPEERMAALEEGQPPPTRAQLVRMSRAYRQPLVVFYLEEPPPRGDRGVDFRTTTWDAPPEEEAWLDLLIRDVQTRHSLIRAALEEDDEATAVPFIGRSRPEEGVEALRNRLIELVGFDRERFRSRPATAESFAYLRERIEETGVFTLLMGDLGSHHTAISVDTFRGYALSDTLAPMIVVNDRDSRAAWSFTMLHEFCHLMLGQSGVSAGFDGHRVERLCNDVASTVLLDDAELSQLALPAGSDGRAMAQAITAFADARRVSRTLVAYRLRRLQRLPQEQWTALADRFRDDWIDRKDLERLKRRERPDGPSYYVVRQHRLGPSLLRTVGYLLKVGEVSVVRAARILGVKPNNVRQTLASEW